MAINFTNKVTQGIGVGFTTIYTCPGSVNSAVVFGITLANKLSTPITVEARMEDLSETEYVHFVAPDTPIEVGSSLVPAGGVQKIVLEPGDKLQVSSSDASSVDAVVSILELS